jgi:hypothetical protein
VQFDGWRRGDYEDLCLARPAWVPLAARTGVLGEEGRQ